MGRRWRWIGHVMRREQDNITRTALHWIPEGKRKRGRPRNTWRRTVESELRSWPRTNRRGDPFVAALRATRHNGHEMRSCSHNLFIVEYPRLPFQLRRNFLSCQCFRFCSNPKFQKILFWFNEVIEVISMRMYRR